MEKIARIKLSTVGWDDLKEMRILKIQHNKTVFKLQREEYSDEKDGLMQEVTNLQNRIMDY
jgi:hypothetical protein